MQKIDQLKENLRGMGRVAVAYSGGVDSNFLLSAAIDTLGRDNCLAVMCNGVMVAERELEEAKQLLNSMGARYVIKMADVLQIPQFAQNHKMRCYYCKKALMSLVMEEAQEQGFQIVLDGKNLDDGRVYRPGARAAQELGVQSPLYEAGFTKQDIRDASKEMGISTWKKPSNACLASRFPYGTLLTQEKLSQAERAEEYLREIGIPSGRVRIHEDIARIEVPLDAFQMLLENLKEPGNLLQDIKSCGFRYVTLDLEGFRSGSFD